MSFLLHVLILLARSYHALSHLEDDSLITKLTPKEMKAIQIEPSFLPEPPQAPARESQTVATIDNAGYGKQLYKIEQTTGVFGDGDLGICSQIGTCCLRNTTRATFCENVLILCT